MEANELRLRDRLRRNVRWLSGIEAPKPPTLTEIRAEVRAEVDHLLTQHFKRVGMQQVRVDDDPATGSMKIKGSVRGSGLFGGRAGKSFAAGVPQAASKQPGASFAVGGHLMSLAEGATTGSELALSGVEAAYCYSCQGAPGSDQSRPPCALFVSDVEGMCGRIIPPTADSQGTNALLRIPWLRADGRPSPSLPFPPPLTTPVYVRALTQAVVRADDGLTMRNKALGSVRVPQLQVNAGAVSGVGREGGGGMEGVLGGKGGALGGVTKVSKSGTLRARSRTLK